MVLIKMLRYISVSIHQNTNSTTEERCTALQSQQAVTACWKSKQFLALRASIYDIHI